MPYIITTTTIADPDGITPEITPDPDITRIAVATLAEARQTVRSTVRTTYGPHAPYLGQAGEVADATARDLNDASGTVGPLPDGTVIEVRRVSRDQIGIAIERSFHWTDHATDDELIAAFNGAHA